MTRTPAKLFTNCPWENKEKIESKSIIGNFKTNENDNFGKVNLQPSSTGLGFASGDKANEIFKAFIPWFLYKPPYGFPRDVNPLQLRQFAKNPYIFGIIRTLQDEVSQVPYEIQLREEYIEEGVDEDKEAKKQITKFFDNPNGNEESFEFLLRSWIKDVCEIGEFVGIKVFNKQGNFRQLFARDAATFLRNPDIYGYYGDREEFVPPPTQYVLTGGLPSNLREQMIGADTPEKADKLHQNMRSEHYDVTYRDTAAYFQYGWTAGARPVPFGKREVIIGGLTPRTNNIYHQSPIEIIYNQVLTLVYGSEYNLDFYLNNNLPNGVLELEGATSDQAMGYRQQMENQFMGDDGFGNFKKKHFRVPITGYKVNFVPMQMTSKEMEVIEQQKWFTRLIWSVFSVTGDEMGFIEDSNKAISENQTQTARRKAVRSLLKMFEYCINSQLMPEFGHPEFEFKFIDYDIEEDKRKHELWQMEINMGVRTPRQIATQELGISEKEFDEEQERKESEQEQEQEQDQEQDDDDDDWWTKGEEEDEDKSETKAEIITEFEKEIKRDLNNLKKKIIEEIEFQREARGLAEIKGFIDIKAITSDALDKFKRFFTDRGYEQKIANVMTEELTKGIEQIEKQFNQNILIDTSVVNELNGYVYQNIKGLNEDLINKLQGEISRGILNNENLTSLKQRINKIFEVGEVRAEAIARTETQRALELGNFEAAKNSGLKLYKYVSVHLDNRTSPICKDLDKKYGSPSKAIPLNEKFKTKEGPIEISPFHVNCRTRVLYTENIETKHKYIKRTGQQGDYTYYYNDKNERYKRAVEKLSKQIDEERKPRLSKPLINAKFVRTPFGKGYMMGRYGDEESDFYLIRTKYSGDKVLHKDDLEAVTYKEIYSDYDIPEGYKRDLDYTGYEIKSIEDKPLKEMDETELKHKYIKRTGSSGNYKYFYKEDEYIKDLQKESVKNNREIIDKALEKIPLEKKMVVLKNWRAFKQNKDTLHKYQKDGQWTKERQKVHKPIKEEYDNAIQETKSKGKPEVVFMAGIPGAGKTYSTKQFFEYDKDKPIATDKKTGKKYVIINTDDIKTKLPEYDNGDGAPIVHEESSTLSKVIMKKAIEENANVIFDGTLSNSKSSLKKVNTFKEKDYDANLIYVDSDVESAIYGASQRFERSGRFTSYEMIAEAEPAVRNSVNKLRDKFKNFKHLKVKRDDIKW